MAFLDLTGEKLGLSVRELICDFSFTVYGGKGVHVEGHKGLVKMGEDEVIFAHKKRIITIKGQGLLVKELSSTDGYVSGVIECVEIGKNE